MVRYIICCITGFINGIICSRLIGNYVIEIKLLISNLFKNKLKDTYINILTVLFYLLILIITSILTTLFSLKIMDILKIE